MGMFNMASTAGLKESGNFLKAGIHKAKFVSLAYEHETFQSGNESDVLKINLNIDGYGDFMHRFFDPTKKNGVDDPTCANRTESQYGQNPSKIEQFMVSLRQIFDALDKTIGEKLDADDVTVNGKKVSVKDLDFIKLCKLAAILTEPYAGTEVEIKVVPQSNGYNDFPGFPAKINKAGMLGIATRFIGHNLTLSQSEERKIAAAENSRPTNMSNGSNPQLEGIAEALDVSSDDLPF